MRRGLFIAVAIVGVIGAVLVFTLRARPDPGKVHIYVYEQKPVQPGLPEPPPDPKPPVPELVVRANRGDVVARAQLCSEGMVRGEQSSDYGDAADWCFLAAQDGDARSQSNYARLLQLGAGV